MQDYIHLLSKPAFYLKAQGDLWVMRCTKCNIWWKPEEETPIEIACIWFLDLPPNVFRKKFVFSLANAVGRPLQVDLATQIGTRTSCAKVKVEVNLLDTLPQRIKIVEEEDETGPGESKWVKNKYNYMPKYYKTCSKCWIIRPELHRMFNEDGGEQIKERDDVMQGDVIGTPAASTKVLTSGKVLGKPKPNTTKKVDTKVEEQIPTRQ